jgi:hypothetical protein
MSDSWMNSIEELVSRWRAESSPARLAAPLAFEAGGARATRADAGADLRPLLGALSRDNRKALTELAEAIRAAMSSLAGAIGRMGTAPAESTPAAAPVAGDDGKLLGELAALRDEVRAALSRPSGAGEVAAAAAPAAVPDLQPLLEKLLAETKSGMAEQLEAIRNALAESSEEDMVGRAGLAKSLKIGMADLAEKNRRALAGLEANLTGGRTGQGDTVTFYPEPVPDQEFETAGDAGAFVGSMEGAEGRKIYISDCYAAQVNDDSMAPLVSDGQTLLVSRSLPARNGDMVIAQLDDGRWVFKRYVRREGQDQLQSLNPILGLPAIVLSGPPSQMHVVVGVVFGRALARVSERAEASAAGAAGGGAD